MDLAESLVSLLDNINFTHRFGSKLIRHNVGILMGPNCVRFLLKHFYFAMRVTS